MSSLPGTASRFVSAADNEPLIIAMASRVTTKVVIPRAERSASITTLTNSSHLYAFGRNANAPRRSTSRKSSSVPEPELMITGIFGCAFLNSFRNSNPLPPLGRPRSLMTAEIS